jgi:hypothetical protein
MSFIVLDLTFCIITPKNYDLILTLEKLTCKCTFIFTYFNVLNTTTYWLKYIPFKLV